MSRWAEAFTALSGGSDTVDTLGHNAVPQPKVSQSVKSVTAPPAPSEPRREAAATAAAPFVITAAMKAELGQRGCTPDQIRNLPHVEAHTILSTAPTPPEASLLLAPEPAAILEPPPAIWGEAEEERAAIVEYSGRIPRAWAEGFARLNPDRPPGDVPLRRWQRFVDDVCLFLDSPFCAVAAALGWGPHDLFGCDRDRPFARTDRAGLLWLLNGDRLIELHRHQAVMERGTGARQTYRRRPVAVGDIMLAWELSGG
jgi:hypothetical protein